jgi:DNA polymerase
LTSCHIDLESRSVVDLKKTGVYVYAEDESTDAWCAGYAFGDGPVEMWKLDQVCPPAIEDHVGEGGVFVAHNANFERILWKHVLHGKYGWPLPSIKQWRCTMAMAYAMALPGSLENAAAAMGLADGKDMSGHRVMMQLARPRKVDPVSGAATWWDLPEKLETLYAYCKQDVVTERALEKRLVPLSDFEQRLWWLDQIINDRGVHVDVALCEAATKVVKHVTEKLNAEMCEVTDKEVSACTNTNQIATWLRAQGLEDTESIAKDIVVEMIARDDLADDVRRVLELRQEAAKASVAKITALMNGRSMDGRARGLLQFCAASTRRWGGRRFQPQNIKRPELDDIDEAISAVMTGNADIVDMLFGPPLSVVGDCLRGMVAAPKGRKILAADFANIEGRVAAWLAGEQWKLDAFRAYDAGTGPDLYKVAYGRSFGVDPDSIDKGDPRRQVGKVQELSMGFGGGAVALLVMAVSNRVDIGASYEMLRSISSVEIVEAAQEAWATRGRGSGWGEHKWVSAEMIKLAWREAHPRTKQSWYDIEDAAIASVRRPGETVACGRLKFKTVGMVDGRPFLVMGLPGGGVLWYPYAEIDQTVTPWGQKKDMVTFRGVDTYTRKWGDTSTYGGKLFENAVQAVARDVLAAAMVRLEKANYPIVLTVHDECVSEVDDGFGSVDEYCAIMREVPDWLDGCPIAAEGFSSKRYRK